MLALDVSPSPPLPYSLFLLEIPSLDQEQNVPGCDPSDRGHRCLAVGAQKETVFCPCRQVVYGRSALVKPMEPGKFFPVPRVVTASVAERSSRVARWCPEGTGWTGRFHGGPKVADYKTHMTVSTIAGVGLGAAAYHAGFPIPTCAVAAGLCSVSGMLPDLDSDSGRPLREATALAAAVVPVMMFERFQQMHLDHDSMILAAGLVYATIRFFIAEIFRRYTVHRGMWHSLPAAAIAGLIAFLLTEGDPMGARMLKSSAVMLGFVSHLILDELWSVDFRGGRYTFKRSFGTALKLWGQSRWANFTTYSKLAVLIALAYCDEALTHRHGLEHEETVRTATDVVQQWVDAGAQWWH
ncbi:MAG: hypothetical protein KatS3mg111_1801 [Pirellulaceae bacterium]|nr:MAG: hypothetical protein KatS3mg111_1801 [Pirellulaceae bacterium]